MQMFVLCLSVMFGYLYLDEESNCFIHVTAMEILQLNLSN